MTIEVFIEKFAGCLEELPSEPLNSATKFKDLSLWDSLALLTFTDTIDMDYGVLLKKADYQACETLGALFECVVAKVS